MFNLVQQQQELRNKPKTEHTSSWQIHSKGLKFGTYGDMGFSTCGGYPGNKFTMEVDAQTFAEWGVDSFKMDGCFTSLDDFHRGIK